MAEAIEIGSEAGVAEIVREYEEHGATAQFSSRAGQMVHCHDCGADEPAQQAPLVALHRVEGASDPGDEAAVAAIECPACGAWGTMVFGYGTEADGDDAAVLSALLDDRDQSRITQGQ